MQYLQEDVPTTAELVDLYDSVGWSAYTNEPELLARAVAGSTFVVSAVDETTLVGLARGLSDDVSIFYLQDILVRPTYQRRGIGHGLLRICFERFDHVRQKVLLTDGEERQHRLYRSAGLHDVSTLENTSLHAFVEIKGLDLS